MRPVQADQLSVSRLPVTADKSHSTDEFMYSSSKDYKDYIGMARRTAGALQIRL